MQLTVDDDDFARVYTYWLKEGMPAEFTLTGVGWLAVEDNGDLHFSEITRKQKIEPDTKGKWAGIFGYQPEEK